jgi:hypothetical protein
MESPQRRVQRGEARIFRQPDPLAGMFPGIVIRNLLVDRFRARARVRPRMTPHMIRTSKSLYSSPRRETALRRRRGEGCIARLSGRLAAIGRQRLRRSERLFHRKSLTFDGFNYSRDKPRVAAEAPAKFLAVPQLGRSVASYVATPARNKTRSSTIGARKSAPIVFVSVISRAYRRWRVGHLVLQHIGSRNHRDDVRFASQDPRQPSPNSGGRRRQQRYS